MSNKALHRLPETGFVRLWDIIGNKKATPPVPPVIPVSSSTWWQGVRTGRFPEPIKLGPHTTAWHVEDICELIRTLKSTQGGER
ncbi:MAG TPA: AlpA family phage regulatory protein [Gammaproteobacteria bacterium]|nr:AlpA family phage regulatory protein [Gammaproteobacteria bacterium]